MKRRAASPILSCLLVACGGARGGGPAENRAAAGGACLPVAGDATYRLVTTGGRTHVCSERAGDDDHAAERACWVVELGAGTLSQSDLVDEPGRGRWVPAAWTKDGQCAEGYCIPGQPSDDGDGAQSSLQLATGASVAVVIGGERGFYLFDASKRLRPLPAGPDRDDGPGASPGEPWIVGDVIFIGDFDAGPHADVHAYTADGSLLGPITDPADHEEYSGDFELFNGTISLLSDHEVAFAEHLLARVLVYDTGTHTTSVWERRTATPAACTAEQRAVFFDPVDVNLEFALEDGSMPRACLDTLKASDGRYGAHGVARAADGALVALTRAADRFTLVHFDAAGVVAREVALPTCGR